MLYARRMLKNEKMKRKKIATLLYGFYKAKQRIFRPMKNEKPHRFSQKVQLLHAVMIQKIKKSSTLFYSYVIVIIVKEMCANRSHPKCCLTPPLKTTPV